MSKPFCYRRVNRRNHDLIHCVGMLQLLENICGDLLQHRICLPPAVECSHVGGAVHGVFHHHSVKIGLQTKHQHCRGKECRQQSNENQFQGFAKKSKFDHTFCSLFSFKFACLGTSDAQTPKLFDGAFRRGAVMTAPPGFRLQNGRFFWKTLQLYPITYAVRS